MSSDPAAAPQGKKRRKSISSPQTDAVLRRWSRSPQAAASDAVPMSPLRGAWASSLVSSPTQPAPKQAAKKHCTDARRHNKGSSTRKTWLLEEKLLWIDRVHFERPADREAPLQAVLIRKCLERNGYAFQTGEERGGRLHRAWTKRLETWLRGEEELRNLSAQDRRRKLFQRRKPIGAEFEKAEKQLDQEADHRADKESRYVGSRWLSLRMKQLVKHHYNGTDFHADKYWRQRFRKRFGYSLRRVSNLKRHSVMERLPSILRWHQKFRHMISDDTDVLTPDGVRQWDILAR
jgi:hypothetical protein